MTEAYTLKFVVVCFSARECAQGLDESLNFAYSDLSNYLPTATLVSCRSGYPTLKLVLLAGVMHVYWHDWCKTFNL